MDGKDSLELIKLTVQDRYGRLAEEEGQRGCGCSPGPSSCCSPEAEEQFYSGESMYPDASTANLPPEVTAFSLGCGDPITLAELEEGQTVLDLGSGGGMDCFLAARKVGPKGRVIGIDMTSEMIQRAEENRIKLKMENVEFRWGEIEEIPVEDESIDVIISNCVINLSPDKQRVFQEAFRVLKAGGKLAVSDIVTDGPLPDRVRESLDAWAGCVAGALDIGEFRQELKKAGFTEVEVEAFPWEEGILQADGEIPADQVDYRRLQNTIFSARITARKPGS